MKEDGYNIIARENIDPIVAETASKRMVDATIEDESLISDIQFFIGKMEKHERRYGKQIQQHLTITEAA